MFLKIVIISIFMVFETFMVICVAFSFFVLKWKGIVFQRKKFQRLSAAWLHFLELKIIIILLLKKRYVFGKYKVCVLLFLFFGQYVGDKYNLIAMTCSTSF